MRKKENDRDIYYDDIYIDFEIINNTIYYFGMLMY